MRWLCCLIVMCLNTLSLGSIPPSLMGHGMCRTELSVDRLEGSVLHDLCTFTPYHNISLVLKCKNQERLDCPQPVKPITLDVCREKDLLPPVSMSIHQRLSRDNDLSMDLSLVVHGDDGVEEVDIFQLHSSQQSDKQITKIELIGSYRKTRIQISFHRTCSETALHRIRRANQHVEPDIGVVVSGKEEVIFSGEGEQSPASLDELVQDSLNRLQEQMADVGKISSEIMSKVVVSEIPSTTPQGNGSAGSTFINHGVTDGINTSRPSGLLDSVTDRKLSTPLVTATTAGTTLLPSESTAQVLTSTTPQESSTHYITSTSPQESTTVTLPVESNTVKTPQQSTTDYVTTTPQQPTTVYVTTTSQESTTVYVTTPQESTTVYVTTTPQKSTTEDVTTTTHQTSNNRHVPPAVSSKDGLALTKIISNTAIGDILSKERLDEVFVAEANEDVPRVVEEINDQDFLDKLMDSLRNRGNENPVRVPPAPLAFSKPNVPTTPAVPSVLTTHSSSTSASPALERLSGTDTDILDLPSTTVSSSTLLSSTWGITTATSPPLEGNPSGTSRAEQSTVTSPDVPRSHPTLPTRITSDGPAITTTVNIPTEETSTTNGETVALKSSVSSDPQTQTKQGNTDSVQSKNVTPKSLTADEKGPNSTVSVSETHQSTVNSRTEIKPVTPSNQESANGSTQSGVTESITTSTQSQSDSPSIVTTDEASSLAITSTQTSFLENNSSTTTVLSNLSTTDNKTSSISPTKALVTDSSKMSTTTASVAITTVLGKSNSTNLPSQVITTPEVEHIPGQTPGPLLATSSESKSGLMSVAGDPANDDTFWPVVAALVIGIPSVIVFGIAITVIHKRRKIDTSRAFYLGGHHHRHSIDV